MKTIIKTFGLISVMAAVSAANGAASRVGVKQSSARRIPSIAGWIVQNGTTTSTSATTTTTTSSAFSDTECIDAYTSCLKAPDVCGTEMEECTTNVLLHAKMPNCLSTLYQCSSSGVNSLFGTTAITNLSNIAEKNTYGEVTRYTYPTDGSVLGQMVIGANISNKLTTDQCVRKYTSCLQRDNICGENFELCTSFKEFKSQAINCASTLARCQGDGLTELFGSTNTAVAPSGTSRIGIAIADGASYAAANAVKTCYKVIDSCLVNACTANPWRCVEGVNMEKINVADFIAGGTTEENTVNTKLSVGTDGTITSDVNLTETTGQDVRKFIKGKCLSVIGGNKACYMTFLEKVPRDRDLADIDNQEDVFSLAYAARKGYANTTIQDILKKFDSKVKNKCVNTIKSCAMRSCGEGIGSVCYSQVFGKNGTNHVNGSTTYDGIRIGCEAIVNTDANCQYAANSASDGGYIYQYADQSVFTTLFPEYEDSVTNSDPIGVVATLDALLQSSYNDAAIANMKKQCQTVALGCVRSMCGKDYTNCYRNRTDIISGTYNTDSAKFNRSMNKMGGVLDYNIVIGLCLNTVKTSSTCEEHLKIAAADWRQNQDTASWGAADGSQYSAVREAWRDANTTNVDLNAGRDVLIACAISPEEAQSKENCNAYDRAEPVGNSCDGVMDEDGCLYTEKIYQSDAEYTLTNAAKSLFQQLLVDVESEAQAKYNAKLTKEQHMCLENNNGGIMGSSENGSTFQWVKLKNNKIPKNYASKGLTASQFTTSNDLYGSFCRARITVMSDDKDIQDNLGRDAVAYFAVGDPFTCGSWISRSTLEKISKVVGDRARKDAGENSKKDKWAKRWWEIGGVVLGGLGGFAGMDSIQRNGGTFGGLLNPSNNMFQITENKNEMGKRCTTTLDKAYNQYIQYTVSSASGNANAAGDFNKAVKLANEALTYARQADADVSGINFTPINGYTPAFAGGTMLVWEEKTKQNIENIIKSMESADDYAAYCTTGSTCFSKITEAKSLLDTVNPENATKIVQNVKSAAGEAAKKADNGDAKAALKAIADNEVLVLNTKVVSDGTAKDATIVTEDVAVKDFPTNVSKLQEICWKLQNEKEDTTKRLTRNLAAGAVGTIAGGLLAHGIVENYYDVKYENAENEAIKQWMDDVGSHINCYLGTEELGSYGDVITFELN